MPADETGRSQSKCALVAFGKCSTTCVCVSLYLLASADILYMCYCKQWKVCSNWQPETFVYLQILKIVCFTRKHEQTPPRHKSQVCKLDTFAYIRSIHLSANDSHISWDVSTYIIYLFTYTYTLLLYIQISMAGLSMVYIPKSFSTVTFCCRLMFIFTHTQICMAIKFSLILHIIIASTYTYVHMYAEYSSIYMHTYIYM